MKLKDLLLLLLLTIAALFIHGYHPGVEDSEIYLSGIEKAYQPTLYPLRTEFFQSHSHLSLFAKLIAASARYSHLPLDFVVFVWHLLSIFLLLFAAYQLAGKVFSDTRACWAGTALLAVLLTLPLGGTGLYIMDQYLNPRDLSAFATVFAITRVLDRKYAQAFLFLIVTAAMHPFMSAFAGAYCVVVASMDRGNFQIPASVLFSPFTFLYKPPSYAYEKVIEHHQLHYVQRWQWYEQLGGLAPFAILWWFSLIAKKRGSTASPEEAKRMRNFMLLCRALVFYGVASVAAALVLDLPRQFETLARLQPMRMLFITYILFVIFSGGLLAEYVLRNKLWRWIVLYVPLCATMGYAQLQIFPASRHIEWPGAHSTNQWVQAFEWVRNNTPINAVFALDPNYMGMRGEDENGFRAIAERSRMADNGKDRGVVTMFPALANEWLNQTQALQNWQHFTVADLLRLKQTYGVDWVVVEQPGIAGLDCPYQNPTVRVCRVP